MTSRLTIVTGPPCAGKSTHIAEHRTKDALVVDTDALAAALGYPYDHIDWNLEHPARDAARLARRPVTDAALANVYSGVDVWIIDSRPHPTSLRIYKRAGATITTIDPGREECHRRASEAGRSPATHEQIDSWYEERS